MALSIERFIKETDLRKIPFRPTVENDPSGNDPDNYIYVWSCGHLSLTASFREEHLWGSFLHYRREQNRHEWKGISPQQGPWYGAAPDPKDHYRIYGLNKEVFNFMSYVKGYQGEPPPEYPNSTWESTYHVVGSIDGGQPIQDRPLLPQIGFRELLIHVREHCPDPAKTLASVVDTVDFMDPRRTWCILEEGLLGPLLEAGMDPGVHIEQLSESLGTLSQYRKPLKDPAPTLFDHLEE